MRLCLAEPPPGSVKCAVHGVIFEQVREGLRIGEIVDSDKFETRGSRSIEARNTLRPIRPNPLMPIRIAIACGPLRKRSRLIEPAV